MGWLYVHLLLYPLVWTNFRLRALGCLPDRWFWADGELFDRGYHVDLAGKLRRSRIGNAVEE